MNVIDLINVSSFFSLSYPGFWYEQYLFNKYPKLIACVSKRDCIFYGFNLSIYLKKFYLYAFLSCGFFVIGSF